MKSTAASGALFPLLVFAFGAAVFAATGDIGSVETVPSGLQPGVPSANYPRWSATPCPAASQAPMGQMTYQGCAANTAGPALIYGDDPEMWDPTTWGTTDSQGKYQQAVSVQLQSGEVFPPADTLVYFYYFNALALPVRFYISAYADAGSGGHATARYFDSVSIDSGSDTLTGAKQSAAFLSKYMTRPGTSFSVGNPALLPQVLKTYSVQPKQRIQGEAFIYGASGNIRVNLTADDCSSPCPNGTNTNPVISAKKDGHARRGFFKAGTLTITHNVTSGLSEAGQYSYLDFVKPQSAIPPLYNGTDAVGPRNDLVDQGDYGAVIQINGMNTTNLKQHWDASPRAGNANNYAFYISGMKNANGAAVNGNYAIPPQGTLTTSSMAGYLGTSYSGIARQIFFLPSGDDTLPARFYYGLF